ncbi:septum formation protein Maf [Sporosarcina sp. BI001-red]|uniref:Maf family protein n=1 Tax=Sporosarcina sp. BI001-red TaxID=2282866 RepID=UPI000E230757|nr:Maf family protein [Sporosarcina sp. BI001-red]REB07178.1 septum formation protein Maf [Sporosarcina sp. BI001-red]
MFFETNETIILASASPRRKELLARLGVPFTVHASTMEERPIENGEKPETYAQALSSIKASAIYEDHPGTLVIGADTVVALDGKVFPKPKSVTQAAEFLQELSGRTHSVITGVTLLRDGAVTSFTSSTEVTFRTLDHALIQAYATSGDPLDKAGGYGIQTAGGLLVAEITGDYENVVGLPIAELADAMRARGLIWVKGDER